MKIYIDTEYLCDIDINITKIEPRHFISHWQNSIYIPEIVQTNFYKVEDLIPLEVDLYLMLTSKNIDKTNDMIYYHSFEKSELKRIVIYNKTGYQIYE